MGLPIMDEELIKRLWQWAGVFLGALVTKVGFGRIKRRKRMTSEDEEQVREITRQEWHDVRDKLNRMNWELDALKREVSRLEEDLREGEERLRALEARR
jgi:septal ring factor EnvC (AmiA/AmiB activator)